MVDPPWVEARPPGALRCGASTMQLERREAIELVLSFRASLLSQVATRLSIIRCVSPALKLKRPNLKKVTKENWALFERHRAKRSCGSYRTCSDYSGAVSLGTTAP